MRRIRGANVVESLERRTLFAAPNAINDTFEILEDHTLKVPVGETALVFDGPAWDWTENEGNFTADRNGHEGVSIHFDPDARYPTHFFYLDFAAFSRTLTVGEYANATEYPFHQDIGMRINSYGGNNATRGFTVIQANYNADGSVRNFAAEFAIEDRSMSAFGTIKYRYLKPGHQGSGVLANDSDSDGGQLTASLVSGPSNGTLKLNADGTFEYVPQPDFYGTDRFTYRASDGTSSRTATATINVLPINDAPSFVGGPDITVAAHAGPQTVKRWATSMSAGPANESQQVTSFDVIVMGGAASLFAVAPALDAETGDLTFTPARNAQGSATIVVRLKDDGRGGAGGIFTSKSEHLRIIVTPAPPPPPPPVNPPPTRPVAGGPYTIGEGGSLTLATAASDPNGDVLSFGWDLDGDWLFDDATGASPTLTWDQLRAAGIEDGPAVFHVRAQVSDGTNIMTSRPTTLTVSNAAPTLTPSGPATAPVGVGHVLQLKGWDYGDDPITRWTIDWGDGTVDHWPGAAQTANHTYATTGSRTIRVWATSDDGKFPGAEAFVDVAAFPAGHNLVKDVYPGPTGSDSRGVTAVGEIGYFVADHPEYGRELWRTDGTPQGTWMVRDIIPGAHGSSPEELTPVGNRLYFRADNKLWKTDGTWRGTVALSDPGSPFGGYAGKIVRYGNGVLFLTALGGALMRSDGTAAGTTVVPAEGVTGTLDVNDAARVVGSKAFFVSGDPTDGDRYAIWAYDGQIARVVRGGFDSRPKLLADDGAGIVYFRFGSSRLWRTDGTINGTAEIKHPYGSGAIYEADDFQILDGRLYFSAILVDQFIGLQYLTRTGRELWSMDPAGLTASMVRDINPGGESGNPSGLFTFNGTAYFSAADSTGRAVWRTDGTEAGTQRATEIWAGADGDAGDFTKFGNGLMFTAKSSAGLGLYRISSPGHAPALVKLLAPPYSGSPTAAPRVYGFVPHNAFVYFVGPDGEIWQTDGTDSGTRPFTAIDPGPDRAFITQLSVAANHLFFTASTEPTGHEVWSISLDNPVPAPIPGTLAGNVFADIAADGVRNAGDYMVAGFRVFLDRNGDGWWNRNEPFTRTDDVGRYTLSDVPAGLYWLRVTHIDGWRFTANDALRVRVTPGGEVIHHFGVTRDIGTIAGSVFNDANGDGARREGGALGFRVFVDADNDGVWDKSERYAFSSGDNGWFEIPELSAGNHWLRISSGNGWRATTSIGYRVAVGAGDILIRHFGVTRNVLITGAVFMDANWSGHRDAAEDGIPLWTVFVDADGDGELDDEEYSVLTDAAGRYAIRTLAGDTHRIRAVESPNYRRTAPAAGHRDLMLMPGEVVTGVNFGQKRFLVKR